MYEIKSARTFKIFRQNLPSQNLSLGHFIITCVGIVAEGIISIDYFISSSFSFAC